MVLPVKENVINFKIMKKILLYTLVSCICLSCNKDKSVVIEGEIYIKLIDFGSMYGASKERIKELKQSLNVPIDSIKNESDKVFISYFNNLVKHGLLEEPYFKLKIKNQEIINVFSNEDDFLRIKEMTKNLNRSKEKIIIQFKGTKKEDKIYFANEIISIKKIKGETQWDK